MSNMLEEMRRRVKERVKERRIEPSTESEILDYASGNTRFLTREWYEQLNKQQSGKTFSVAWMFGNIVTQCPIEEEGQCIFSEPFDVVEPIFKEFWTTYRNEIHAKMNYTVGEDEARAFLAWMDYRNTDFDLGDNRKQKNRWSESFSEWRREELRKDLEPWYYEEPSEATNEDLFILGCYQPEEWQRLYVELYDEWTWTDGSPQKRWMLDFVEGQEDVPWQSPLSNDYMIDKLFHGYERHLRWQTNALHSV